MCCLAVALCCVDACVVLWCVVCCFVMLFCLGVLLYVVF